MNKEGLYKLVRILSLLVIFSFLLPSFKIGGFGMKLDLVFLFPSLFFVFLIDRNVKHISNFKKLGFLTVLLFLNMLMSDSFGLFYFNQQKIIYFPTEFIQVFSRVAAFYVFFYIAYNHIITFDKFKKYCNIIFISSLVFGLIQLFDIPLIKEMSRLYALTETQLQGFESVNQRGYGVAGNILTWGGLSGFMFYYFYYLGENKIIKLIGCSLAIINISISVSRTAIISLIVSFILINLIIALLIKKNLISFLKIVFGVTIIFTIAYYSFVNFFSERYELIVMRFSYMDEALNETGRGAQREFFINFLNNDYWNYFIGIGKPTLDGLGYMEMEPLFLLVAYGVTGLVLHYLLIYYSLNRLFKIKDKNEKLFGFIAGSTIFYLIFSIGFFFMREAYSGLIYWILMGFFLGNVLTKK